MSSKRHIRRKACKGKHRYTNAAEAQAAISGLHRRKGYQGYMQAYHCSFAAATSLGIRPSPSV